MMRDLSKVVPPPNTARAWLQRSLCTLHFLNGAVSCFGRNQVLPQITQGWADSSSSLKKALIRTKQNVQPSWRAWTANSRAVFEGIRKSMSPLATWEMKSLSTGSPEVMTAVLTLGEFSWTFCTADDCNTNTKHKKVKERADEVFVGPDAQTTPWSLPGPVTRRVTRSAAVSGSSTLPLSSQRTSRSSEHGSPMKDKGKKRKRDDEEDQHHTIAQSGSGSSTLSRPSPSASRISEHGPPTKDKGKERKRDDDQDQHDISAQSLVQQVTCGTMSVKIILMC